MSQSDGSGQRQGSSWKPRSVSGLIWQDTDQVVKSLGIWTMSNPQPTSRPATRDRQSHFGKTKASHYKLLRLYQACGSLVETLKKKKARKLT